MAQETANNLESLAAKMQALPTMDKLLMAAELIACNRADMAELVIKAALEDLQATRLLGITRAPLQRGPR